MTLHRKFWLSCLVLAVLFFLYATEERFRGRWALERWKRQMIAQGEKFEIAELTPPAVPESTKAYFDLLDAARQMATYRDYLLLAPPGLRCVAPGKAVVVRDLTEWTLYRTMRSKLGVTNVTWDRFARDFQRIHEPIVAVKTALDEPRFNANLNYESGTPVRISEQVEIRRAAHFLAASAAIELRAGEKAIALDDLIALSALANCLQDERDSLTQQLRAAIFQITLNAEWQALQAPGWKDSELEKLQHNTARIEHLRPMTRALEMERAIGLRNYDRARDDGQRGAELFPGGGRSGGMADFSLESIASITSLANAAGELSERIATLMRRAFIRGIYVPLWQYTWSHQDELRYAQAMQTVIDGLREATIVRSGANMEKVREHFDALIEGNGWVSQLRFPLLSTAEWAGGMPDKAVGSVSLRELAVAAIALKRYELKHGQPATELASLVPEFLSELPRDFMDGQPLRYRRRPDGTFVLYSVGKDRRDDQGDPDGSILGGLTRGRDWVWPTPATAEEIAADDARLKMQDGGTILPEAYSSAAFMKRYGRLMQKSTAQTNAPATGSGGGKSP